MLFTIIYAVAVVVIVGGLVMVGFVLGVNDEKNRIHEEETVKWSRLISRSMSDAYSAGYTDGRAAGKARPSKAVK